MTVKSDSVLDPIGHEIWDMKYRLKDQGGEPREASVADTWARVATAAASAEAPGEQKRWAKAFAKILADYRFLPAGRILAGAGTGRNVTLFNCFVMGCNR